jgi:hypothetical protein
MLYTFLKIQKRKPLIIFLHGSEKGTDIEKVNMVLLNLKNNDLDAYVLALNVQKTNIGILKYCTN